MATPSMTVEEIQLRRRARHRLAGAVTLVTLLVVFLPMVLDSDPKPVAEDIAINIPSQDAKPAITGSAPPPEKIVPRTPVRDDAPPPVQTVATASSPPAIELQPAPPAQTLTVLPGGQAATAPLPAAAESPKPLPAVADKVAPPAAKPAPQPKAVPPAPAPAAKEVKAPPAAEKTPPAAPTDSGFVVRLGAYSDPENARRVKAKLASMGIRHYSDVLKTASGDKHRVRAGPYATRREAEAIRVRLKAVDVDGDVVPKP